MSCGIYATFITWQWTIFIVIVIVIISNYQLCCMHSSWYIFQVLNSTKMYTEPRWCDEVTYEPRLVAKFCSMVMFHHIKEDTNCLEGPQSCYPVCQFTQFTAFNSNVEYFFDEIYWNPIHTWICVTSLDDPNNGHDADMPCYIKSIHFLPNDFSMWREVINISKTM